MLPATHEEVGRHLAERWNLPEPLVEVVGAHNSLSFHNEKHATLVCLIHVADARCRQLKVGRAGDDMAWQPAPKAMDQLGITVAALGGLGGARRPVKIDSEVVHPNWGWVAK